jgi:hypothetical protein
MSRNKTEVTLRPRKPSSSVRKLCVQVELGIEKASKRVGESDHAIVDPEIR